MHLHCTKLLCSMFLCFSFAGRTTFLEISDPSKWDRGKKKQNKKANPHTLYCLRHFNQNFPGNFWPIKVRQGEKKRKKEKKALIHCTASAILTRQGPALPLKKLSGLLTVFPLSAWPQTQVPTGLAMAPRAPSPTPSSPCTWTLPSFPQSNLLFLVCFVSSKTNYTKGPVTKQQESKGYIFSLKKKKRKKKAPYLILKSWMCQKH